jgi:hypothetical protein
MPLRLENISQLTGSEIKTNFIAAQQPSSSNNNLLVTVVVVIIKIQKLAYFASSSRSISQSVYFPLPAFSPIFFLHFLFPIVCD